MEDIFIDEIVKAENLPYRTIKICNQLGITSLNDIINYYHENNTFLKANVCGKKTNQDLINVYNKYTKNSQGDPDDIELRNFSFYKEESPGNMVNNRSIIYKINQLDEKQRSIINNKIIIKLDALSVRGHHAIKCLLQDDYTIDSLNNYVFSDNYFNFKNLRNVGKNTIPELNNFIIEIREEIEKLIKLNKNKNIQLADEVDNYQQYLNNEFVLSTLQKYFGVSEKIYEPVSNYYLKSKNFPLFKMLNILIQNGFIFNQNELLVFNNILNFTTFENQSIQEISAKVDLTGERVRQIKYIILNNFESRFSFIINFLDLVRYDVFDLSKSYIYIDDEASEYLNFIEEVHFSKLFYIYIFAILSKQSHSLIGNISINISEPKIKKIINNEFCLIFRKYIDIYDFNAFIKDIYIQIHKRKTRTFSYNLEEYLTRFYKGNAQEIVEIADVCKKILCDNFNINPDIQGNINFARNTKKLTYEYLIDILEENKRPMHFVELYKECVKRGYPIKSDMGVHSTLINHSDIFGLKGAGTFNLRKFGGYFGTIGNVAEKYLKEKGCPVSLYELEKFINKELIISKYSIRMVLFKYKHENRFVLDFNNMVSLREWK